MKKTLLTLFAAACSLSMWAKADFANFAITVDDKSSLFEESEKVQWQAYSMGIAVVDGVATRVATDAENCIAVVTGKYHGDHGSAGLKVEVPIPAGSYNIEVANCQYSGKNVNVTDASGNVIATKETAKACWKDNHDEVTKLTVNVAEATTIAISGMDYCGYVKVAEAPVVAQTPFSINLTSNDVTLPKGVTQVSYPQNGGAFHDSTHGWSWFACEFNVNGPVAVSLGGCQYSNNAYIAVNGTKVADIDTQSAGCGKDAVYYYTGEAATLTVYCGLYCPSLKVEAYEVVSEVVVTYYDADKTTVLKKDTVKGGSELAYAVAADKVTVGEGQKFRRWVNEKGLNVAEKTVVTDNLNLYALVTDIEKNEPNTSYDYDMTVANWYQEDHELIEIDGSYYNNHGWTLSGTKTIKVQVAGNSKVTVKNCQYSSEADVTVVDANGKDIATFNSKAESDGLATTFNYEGDPTTLTMTFPKGGYVHGVSIVNKEKVVSDNPDMVIKEKVLYKTNFQDWSAVSASTSETVVKQTTIDGQELSFTLYNTACDPKGANTKFTAEICTDGYLQTNKDATNLPYIITSPLANITSFEVIQAATGSNRGLTVYVKGEGDADWVELHNKSIAAAAGEQLSFTVNRKNCQIKFGAFAPNQNAYILSLAISGNVEVPARKFVPFKIDFRTQPYTVVTPESGVLPAGVVLDTVKYHGNQHGYQYTKIVVPVDGSVKFTIGGCQYTGKNATVTNKVGVVTEIDTKGAGCDNGFGTYTHGATYIYNSESADTLTFDLGEYCPWFQAVDCDFIADATVFYYNTDGKLLGQEVVPGNSALTFKYGASDVTVAEGKAFRGWFDGKTSKAKKVKEGIAIVEDTKLYATATDIEVATLGAIFKYELNKVNFYPEDHEVFTTTGAFHDGQHGFEIGANGNVTIQTAGNALINLGLCQYGNEGSVVVTDAAGNTVGEPIATPLAACGQKSVTYTGEPTTLTFTFTNGGYLSSFIIYNVKEIPTKSENGYFEIAAGDGASLLLALASLKDGDRIYLPNGTYDFGETALTTISANNVSIIGESMEGTIIKNAPLLENEGIGTTATLLNTSNNLYLQDLTIQNALSFNGGTGRAVCLQDKGKNTICKNVRLLSFQDTYYSNAASNFYWEDCEIHGVVDYVCGDGDVVYNRTKFVNEQIKNTTIAAPYTSESCKWGYVMLDCDIETLCTNFNFGRSWGGDSKLQYIRCKDLNNKLVASRWTTAGMNIAAYKFMEYGNMDKDGNITTPASNVVNFTHSSGDKKYETVLTAEEAAQYTVANIYGAWAPDSICAQVTEVAKGTLFLVDGKITTVAPTEGSVRIANGRGGFGPVVTLTGIKSIESVKASDARAYDLSGRQSSAKGLFIQNGKVMMKK